MVFDEAHKLKGANSSTRAAAQQLDASWRLLLTGERGGQMFNDRGEEGGRARLGAWGAEPELAVCVAGFCCMAAGTPIQNNLGELWSILNILDQDKVR